MICFSFYKNCEFGAHETKKCTCCNIYFVWMNFFLTFGFYLNVYILYWILSEYIYLYLSKNITSCTFHACFKNHQKPSAKKPLSMSNVVCWLFLNSQDPLSKSSWFMFPKFLGDMEFPRVLKKEHVEIPRVN